MALYRGDGGGDPGVPNTANVLSVQGVAGGTAVPVSGTVTATVTNLDVALSTRLSESDFDTKTGSLTESAPATDTASSGLNGRLQRIAQRLSSLIALLPGALGSGGGLKVDGSGTALPVTLTSTTITGTVAATQSGTWTVQPGNTANTTAWKVDGSAVTQPVSGTVTASNTAGDVAHDGADSGNPVKVAGKAAQTNITAVADGDRANLMTDDMGRLVTIGEHVRDLVVQASTTITSSSAETTILAAGAGGVFHDVMLLVMNNTSATSCTGILRDATGGTQVMKFVIANTTNTVVMPTKAVKQTTAANNWTLQLSSSSVASVEVFIQAVKNV